MPVSLNRQLILLLAGVLLAGRTALPQDAASDSSASRRWSLHFQATSIGQHHGYFNSPYEGTASLPPHPENRVSITGTIFMTYRLNSWTELVVDPELAGGKGFGQVTGVAGFPNGEIPRVAAATPTLYLARGYVRNTWALGSETGIVEGGPNQLPGRLPV